MTKTQATLGSDGSTHPAYINISLQLRAEIAAGKWTQGSLIPTEPRLADYFGVSIGTIRHAIGILSSEGLLIKRQGLGTFVQSSAMQQLYSNPSLPFELSSEIDLDKSIKSSVKAVLAGNATEKECKALGIDLGAPIWRVSITHSVEYRVAAHEIIAISQVSNPDLTQELLGAHANNLHRLANEVLKQRIERIRDKVQIQPLGPEMARVFKYDNGASPFLRVYRTTSSIDDKPIEHREIWIDPSIAHYSGQPEIIK